MTDTIKVVVKIRLRPDRLAEGKKLLLWLAEKSRAEHGCVSYAVLESIGEPNIFLLYEEWDSPAALNAHGETAHVRESYAQAGVLVSAAPERTVLKTVG